MTRIFTRDVRFAARQLARRPAFTITSVLILALGLGANTAIFTVVHAFLLRPLPYKDPDFLTALFERDPVGPLGSDSFNPVAPGNFLDWQRLSTSFEQIAATAGGAFNLSHAGQGFEPQRVDAAFCSSNLFPTLGVSPVLGRGFHPEEDRYGAARVAVISYGLWQRYFGGSANVIHQQIRLDGENHQIVGVMPRGFGFPDRTVEVWTPLLANITPEQQRTHSNHFLMVVGRLRRGIAVERARAEIDTIAARYKQTHPDEITGKGGNVVRLQEYLVKDVRVLLLALLGAVGCVLLIACVNLANLLLTGAAGRTREVAIRQALGAGRSQIIVQFLTESILLAFAGACCGLLLAGWITETLAAHAPGANAILPAGHIAPDTGVFLFTLVIAVATGIAAGMLPAIQSSWTDLVKSLKDSTRSATSGRSHRHFRSILVATEVALSLVLLIAAGLLLRSSSRLLQITPGVRVDHSLTIGIALPDRDDTRHAEISAFLGQLAEALKNVPGVRSAGLVSCAPIAGHCSDAVFFIEGKPLPPGQMMDALYRGADPGYFAAAGIPLLRGRVFTRRDGIGFDEKHPRPGVIIISESLAKRFFGGEDPIGRHIYIGFDVERNKFQGLPVPRYEVIGVVGDVLQSLDSRVEPTIYLPLLDGTFDRVHIVLHTSVEPHSVTAAARKAIHRLNPDLPVFQVRTM